MEIDRKLSRSDQCSYHVEALVGILVETGTFVQLRMDVGEADPVAAQIVRHDVDGVDYIAQFGHVVALLQSEFGQRNGQRDFPTFADRIESRTQFADERQIVVLVLISAASISSTRVFPIDIQTIETVLSNGLFRDNQQLDGLK